MPTDYIVEFPDGAKITIEVRDSKRVNQRTEERLKAFSEAMKEEEQTL